MNESTPVVQIRRVVATIDGSEHSERSAILAVEIAKQFGAKLYLLHVASYPPMDLGRALGHTVEVGAAMPSELSDRLKKRAMETFARVEKIAREKNIVASPEILDSEFSISETILGFANERNIDLIVAGTVGIGAYSSGRLGRVSTDLVNQAHCSVLVVR